MMLRIEAIEPGTNANDVLVTVAYWHGPRIVGPAHFIEEHSIIGVPEVVGAPKKNRLGQYYSAIDGTLVNPWVMNDLGEWVPRTPKPDEVVFEIDDAERTLAEQELILKPLRTRAETVARNGLRGQDRYAQERRPKPGPPVPGRMSDRPSIAGLINRVIEV